MNRYTVTPRGKKYLVEEVDADGTRRIVISFPTEEAAVIPILTDQNRWAQSRMPRDMMVQG